MNPSDFSDDVIIMEGNLLCIADAEGNEAESQFMPTVHLPDPRPVLKTQAWERSLSQY